jgi:uncharacterized protein (TIGR02594 family)
MGNRRQFLESLAVVLASSALTWATDTLPHGIGTLPDYNGPLPQIGRSGSLGSRPPLNAEEKIAKAIILKSPVGPTPFAVANFFLDVSNGKYGKQWQPYAQGWPLRWNPVIVTFFQATGTKPEGDLTPWCAAFVNWCFMRAGKGFATSSASSGSFRTFGTETSSPAPGDIVVFKRIAANEADDLRGHVGFFVRFTSNNEIQVLGGNHIDTSLNSHMISSKPLKRRGTKLILHSFRTDQRLHS